jgi:hypothetical protein
MDAAEVPEMSAAVKNKYFMLESPINAPQRQRKSFATRRAVRAEKS